MQNESLDLFYRFGDILHVLKIHNPKYAFSPIEATGFRKKYAEKAQGEARIGMVKALREGRRQIWQQDPAMNRSFGDVTHGGDGVFGHVMLGRNPDEGRSSR